jgi:hypothetical protein
LLRCDIRSRAQIAFREPRKHDRTTPIGRVASIFLKVGAVISEMRPSKCAQDAIEGRSRTMSESMPISMPTFNLPPVPKALFDIVRMEGSQRSLPESDKLAGGAMAAYAVAEMLAHMVEHSFLGSVVYGVVTVAALTAITYFALKAVGARDRLFQTLTALGAMGALVCLGYIILHFFFAVALPPPLPSDRLVRFLLFPLIVWNLFMFAWIYRHALLRPLPAFVAACLYVVLESFILTPLLK